MVSWSEFRRLCCEREERRWNVLTNNAFLCVFNVQVGKTIHGLTNNAFLCVLNVQVGKTIQGMTKIKCGFNVHTWYGKYFTFVCFQCADTHVHVLLNLLNKLRQKDKMRGLQSILSPFHNKFNQFINTGAQIYVGFYLS